MKRFAGVVALLLAAAVSSEAAAPVAATVQTVNYQPVGTVIVGTYLVTNNGPPFAGVFSLAIPSLPPGVVVVGQSTFAGIWNTGEQKLLTISFTPGSAPNLPLVNTGPYPVVLFFTSIKIRR